MHSPQTRVHQLGKPCLPVARQLLPSCRVVPFCCPSFTRKSSAISLKILHFLNADASFLKPDFWRMDCFKCGSNHERASAPDISDWQESTDSTTSGGCARRRLLEHPFGDVPVW